MRINAHSITPGDDIEFTHDGDTVTGMVTYVKRVGPNMMFEIWTGSRETDYGLDMWTEVELLSDTERVYDSRFTTPAQEQAPAPKVDLTPTDLEGFDAF